MKKFVLLTVMFFLIACLHLRCKETPPEPPSATLTLRVEDASCTEAWLKATTTELPVTVAVLRDGRRISVSRLLSPDSLLFDEGLLPLRTYTYQLQKLGSDSAIVETSATARVATMDTTSHNFAFSIDTLGTNLSILIDIAVINDSLAYATGIISVLDSTGQLSNPPFNMARWNGQTWEYMRRLWDCRLYFPNCGPTQFFLFDPIRSIAAFGPNDIWVAAGTAQHFDGNRWTEYAGVQGVGSALKMWGTSSSDLWFVGYNGFVCHFTGAGWQQIQSGVALTFNDIWGGSNREVGNNSVLIAASEKFTFSEKRVVRIRPPAIVDTLSWPMQQDPISSLWFNSHSNLYACGSGVFVRKNGLWKRFSILPSIYTNCIRGSAENDIWVAGDFGLVAHFNGFSWHVYSQFASGGIFHSLCIKGNQIIIVGEIPNDNGASGIVVRGRRL